MMGHSSIDSSLYDHSQHPKQPACLRKVLYISFHCLLTDVLLERKYILSLDGGGFRGLSSLIILNHIMRMLVDDPDDEPIPSPCQIFDLICGTSTGGVIAILLGRLGLDCLTAISIYKELGPRVFGRDEGKMWSHILAGEKFSSAAFETFLWETVERYTGSGTTAMKIRKLNPDAVEHLTTDVRNFLDY